MDEKPNSTSADHKATKRRAQKADASRRFYERNRERLRVEASERLKKDRDAINARRRERYQERREAVLKRNAEWAKKNRDKIKSARKSRMEKDGESIKAKRRQKQPEATKRVRAWRDKNREKQRAYTRQYESQRRSEDIEFRLRKNLRGRIRGALKDGGTASSVCDLVGCTMEQLKAHLEANFQAGMSWENWTRDGWHIDHIRPLASFDLLDESQITEACHWSNLQPLWASDNLSKGGRYEHQKNA